MNRCCCRRAPIALAAAAAMSLLVSLVHAADRTDEAARFVALLERAQVAAAYASFDETMKSALPQAKLGELWVMLQAQAGGFQKQERTRRETVGDYDVVFVTCRFERALVDVKVVYDAAGRVAGLFFLPAAAETPWQPPAYCRPGSFQEREATVDPALVLVHGSGPQDRDETIGPNKTFADLACGLASRGVAVLRYEKRTRQYASRLAAAHAALTVKEETVDDAVAAAQLLRATPGIDARRVFVLGHSLGGMLVPRIAQVDPSLRGLVILAGTTRPLEGVMLEQLSYISSLAETTEADRRQVAAMQAGVAQVEALPRRPAPPTR